MVKFKVTVENLTKGKDFILKLIYSSKTEEDIPFRFSNANKSIEVRRLKVMDKEGKVLEKDGGGHISPRNWDETNTTLTDTKTFVYEIKGIIEPVFDRRINLNMFTAQYLLKRGEPYYFYHEYEGEQSNKVEIIF